MKFSDFHTKGMIKQFKSRLQWKSAKWRVVYSSVNLKSANYEKAAPPSAINYTKT